MPSERVQRRIDRLLDQADEALETQDWQRAYEASEAALGLDPGNEDAKAFLESSRRGLGAAGQTPAVSSPSEQLAQSHSSDLPSSFSSGRYTVSQFLGEGGKKKVYLAHDNTLDRDVAFALIKTEGLDETSRERVKREAQAMGRMGTHPSIMPIYDLGEENGQPYMVQPLMGGGDVEGLVEDAEGPLELDRAITIATQTAQGLSFAHGKGIVHRDLKPGNVWLDEDGAAKIGDFGLAVATDRSRLTVEKVMVGTVSYMPPEQATGGEVTPQADLYSLGAMLYEMCTGRVPFMGDDDIGIISQHINTPPVAPSWHNHQIPKTLDSLILRLLAKDPAERPSDADEVLVALEAVDLSAVEEREEESKGSLDAMAGGVFVGRHREMDQLKAIFEDVLSGRGRMVTLVGEPGIGKTRTAQELATYAGMRGAEVLWGRSYESGGAPPYWPWVQAIRSHVASTEPQGLRDQLGATAPVIAEVVSDVKAKLPDTPAPTPIEDPESARFRLFDSISTFLKNTASSTPLVVMLEDLHWSDKPSLTLLEFVARELANSRILIVGNYRDMELNRRHPLSVTLGDLTRERLFERVVLRGLQRHDVQRFIEIAAGIAPPPALVDAVHSQTEGNPLFVTETVRLLIQEGDITSGQSSKGGTTSWEIRIPEGVREVIGRRLDRLSERCNDVLTTAAVIGRQFRFDVLKMLTEDSTEGQLLDAMDESLSARIIEELPDEVGFYQFTHAQMQETMVSELSSNRLVRMHARIAEVLEAHYGDKAQEHAAELAEHFAEAETVLGTDRLIMYSLAAGKRALDAFGWEEADLHYGRAYALFEAMPAAAKSQQMIRVEADATVGLAWAHFGGGGSSYYTGEIGDVWWLMQRAHDLYVQVGETEDAIDALLVPITMGGAENTVERFSQAMELVEPGTEHHGWVLTRLGTAYQDRRGRLDRGRELLQQAIGVAQSLSNKAIEARANAHLCQTYFHSLEPDPGIAAGEKAISLAIEGGDLPSAMRTMQFLADAYVAVGRLDDASMVLENTIALGDDTHHTNWNAWCSIARSSISALTGDWSNVDSWNEKSTQYDHGQALRIGFRPNHMFFERDGNDVPAGITARGIENWDAWNMSPTLSAAIAAAAHIARATGDVELALAVKQAARSMLQHEVQVPRVQLGGWQALGMLSGPLNEPELANEAVPHLVESHSQAAMWSRLSHDRIRGTVLATSGRSGEAAEAFEKARVFNQKSGYSPELAWTCADYAEMLLERNNLGDREKAIELQDEAISIATDLGMKPLLERVLAKRQILKA